MISSDSCSSDAGELSVDSSSANAVAGVKAADGSDIELREKVTNADSAQNAQASQAELAETEMGVTWGSTAHLQAIDFTGSDAVIFRFDDDYKLNGRDEKVGLFAMRKAALNSSRALAEHTLDYWKTQH